MRREDLYSHYERELLYLRRAGEGFARAYPKVAKRLALGPESAGDPHVERLIESFAFLTARVQMNLDRQFPVFTDALLDILYPHLSAPIPSCGIARLVPDGDAGQLTDGHVLPRGTELVAAAGEDARCRFTTTAPLTLWPVALTETAAQAPDGTP
ncbi:MAG: type VI secretion system baseplate subunit TssF, partial [Caenispirillum sp.]|nr:type VI secretion system baseplate subunit TssF [Caenispirillum sp.]